MTDRTALVESKAELRRRMRTLRKAITDPTARSGALWRHVEVLPEVLAARRVLLFRSILGEPEIDAFEQWCSSHAKTVGEPEHDVDATWPDVVVVPGLAFTADGHRLGQGGGWYDRFLVGVRDDCVTIGVCFHEQLLDEVPIEPHDIALDHVVTDRGVAG
jgi:5-formyltetrahydrofolate cyclo-ligase